MAALLSASITSAHLATIGRRRQSMGAVAQAVTVQELGPLAPVIAIIPLAMSGMSIGTKNGLTLGALL